METVSANPRMPEIVSILDSLSSLIDRQRRIHRMAKLLLEECMANEQDLRDRIKVLKDAVLNDQQSDQVLFTQLVQVREQLKAKVKELQDQIAAGQQPAVDFDSLINEIDSIGASLVAVKDETVTTDPTVPDGETPVDPDAPPGIANLGGSNT